jgi:hypothetical protein
VLLPGVDGRSPWVRRCKDIINAHVSDLGGEANMSAAEFSIVRRCAALTVECEALEVQFANPDRLTTGADLDLYQRMTNTLRRSFEALGLRRRSRDVTPTLADILREGGQTARVEEEITTGGG